MEYLPDLLDPFHLNDGDIRHIVEIRIKLREFVLALDCAHSLKVSAI